MAPKPSATITGTALAEILDVSLRRVQQFAAEGMPSRMVDGERRFVAKECVRWVRERDAEAIRKERDGDKPNEADERARKLKLEADMVALKLAERRGELVPVAQVLKSDEKLFGVIRARVRAMRGKWAPRVLGLGTMGEATSALDALADDILAALVDGAADLEQDEPEADAA